MSHPPTPPPPTGTTPDQRTLITLPRELRDKILQEVLLNPTRPDFESLQKPTEYQFRNYFTVGFVNKQLHEEAKDVLIRSKGLVILSSNWCCLGPELEKHNIPIVSEHHLRTLKLHSMRIHLDFPNCGKPCHKKVLSSMILLASDIPDVSRVLRALSLDAPHPPVDVFMVESPSIKPYPRNARMSMRIQFEEDIVSTQQEKAKLLGLLKGANMVGTIKILKSNDPTLSAILPGYDGFEYKSNFADSPNGRFDQKGFVSWYASLKITDAKDHLSLAIWKSRLGRKASNAKNYELAEQRFREVIRFIVGCYTNNMEVMNPELPFAAALQMALFRAGIRLVKVMVRLRKHDDAKHELSHILDDIPPERKIPEVELQEAFKLQKKVHDYIDNGYHTPTKERKSRKGKKPIAEEAQEGNRDGISEKEVNFGSSMASQEE